jgi:glutaminase
MVKGSSPDEVWKKILGMHSDFAGRQLEVDQEVYKSEADTNQRNRAIGALMSAYERFPSDPAGGDRPLHAPVLDRRQRQGPGR